jgi:hypothetical protein
MDEQPRPPDVGDGHAVCSVCGRLSDHFWRGWLAYRVESVSGEPPELGFYCPECAERELRSHRPRRG